MAFSASGIYVDNIIDALDTTNLAINFQLDTHRIALYNNTKTPDYGADTGFSSTNEVTGTGWNSGSSGGHLLSAAASGSSSTSPTLTESPAGSMMYDMADVSVASTTLTNVRGAIIYADALAADNNLVGITFGADYSTSNGTFGIQWAGTGVFAIDLTP